MSSCFTVGMAGDCCLECPVFLRGECENAEEFLEGATEEERALLWDLYGVPPVMCDILGCGGTMVNRGGLLVCSNCANSMGRA